jgi:membrane protease YdiL (CAAX protease family)
VSLGLYALVLYLWPELVIWIPSDAYHAVILVFPLGLIALHVESRPTLGLRWGNWRLGAAADGVVIAVAILVYWLVYRRFNAPALDHILIATVVWGPIAEEILFRSYLQPKLETICGRWPGLVITSILFGISHLPRIYLRQAAAPVLVPEAIALGMVFGFIKDRTDSVYYGMICHMAYNLIATVV